VVPGPGTDILVPAAVPDLRPEGFMLRFGPLDEIAVEMLASSDAPSRHHVIARLMFTDDSFQRFVEGLNTVRDDLSRHTR
jgi:hypothetical protein